MCRYSNGHPEPLRISINLEIFEEGWRPGSLSGPRTRSAPAGSHLRAATRSAWVPPAGQIWAHVADDGLPVHVQFLPPLPTSLTPHSPVPRPRPSAPLPPSRPPYRRRRARAQAAFSYGRRRRRRAVEDMEPMSVDSSGCGGLDAQIEQLLQCRPLAEQEVRFPYASTRSSIWLSRSLSRRCRRRIWRMLVLICYQGGPSLGFFDSWAAGSRPWIRSVIR